MEGEQKVTTQTNMIKYFQDDDFEIAKKRRNKMLIGFFIILGVYLAFSAGMLVWYLLLPYKSGTIGTVKLIHYVVGAIMVGGMFVYLGLPFKRANKFYHMVKNMQNGIRESSTASFFEYDETLQEKDGVDFKALIFLEWNKYKKDFFERKVLVFYDRPFPQFNENDNVKFITQGNVLISYEILD